MEKKTKNPIATLINQINEAKKGSFVVFKNYKGSDGIVQTIYGNLKVSYAENKKQAIVDLKDAITKKDFESITVKGQCRFDDENKTWNAKKRSAPLKEFEVTFKDNEVLDYAKAILFDWENPKERENNNIDLGAIDGSVKYNEETENFNVQVQVSKTVYKEDLSTPINKPENSAPETLLKELIRKRFEKKIRTLTIGKDKCESISLNGEVIIL